MKTNDDGKCGSSNCFSVLSILFTSALMFKCAPRVKRATENTESPSTCSVLASVTCFLVTKLNDAIYPKCCQKIETLLDATESIFTQLDLKGTDELPEKIILHQHFMGSGNYYVIGRHTISLFFRIFAIH